MYTFCGSISILFKYATWLLQFGLKEELQERVCIEFFTVLGIFPFLVNKIHYRCAPLTFASKCARFNTILQNCPNVAYNSFLQLVLVVYLFSMTGPRFFLIHCPSLGTGRVTEHIAQFLVVDKHHKSVQYRFNTKCMHFPNRTSLCHRYWYIIHNLSEVCG